MEKELAGVTLEAVQGDIATQDDVEAVVNAANRELRIGGGVAGAIHRAAGPELEKECQKYAPISPGEAVITGAHNLPNDYVIHCLGPVYGTDKPEDKLLADCYRNALAKAEEYGISRIGFPAISTGAFGYPIKEAIKVVKQTLEDEIPQLKQVRRIRFVLFDKKTLQVYQEEFLEKL